MNLKKIALGIVAVSLLAAPVTSLAGHIDPNDPNHQNLINAQTGGGNAGGGNATDATARGEGFGFTPEGLQGLETGSLVTSIVSVINALLVLAAIAAVVFMIIGGVRYVTSQGDEDAVAQAKNTVIYAIIGVIVILLAAVIINFFIAAV